MKIRASEIRIESSAQNYTQIYNHYANIQGTYNQLLSFM